MHVEPTDSFLTIKHRIGEIFTRSDRDVKLFKDENGEDELVDAATIADKEIEHDAIIYAVLMKQGDFSNEINQKSSQQT
jgi:hypothetical protein